MAQILVVDDSVSMRKMVSSTLISYGHQTEVADDGKTALTVARSSSFDIVVTDLNMPLMNGIELVRNLRSMANYKYTPTLLLTTETSADKKMEAKQAGATGWLVKPFNPDTLLSTISRVLV